MKKNPIYVVGHKNPDTDAIVSAIAYAEYKKEKGFDAVAARVGSVSSETEYLLEKFGYEDPKRLYTAKSILKEIEMDKAALANKEMTMKDALDKVIKLKTIYNESYWLKRFQKRDLVRIVWDKNGWVRVPDELKD